VHLTGALSALKETRATLLKAFIALMERSYAASINALSAYLLDLTMGVCMGFELEISELAGGRALKNAAIELCEAGLLTCTHGKPGDENARYALGWLPLDNPNQYSDEVQARHTENMRHSGNRHG